ncbi:hypothetical protein B0H21DRAFT_759297 [Amylocystis lapponica]|nr:hypothetical protein B0H21DRAFT_759297 [Amylocystis lapponica]
MACRNDREDGLGLQSGPSGLVCASKCHRFTTYFSFHPRSAKEHLSPKALPLSPNAATLYPSTVMSDNKHLAAVDWLGFGLDMTNLTPFDFNAVKPLIHEVNRIIEVENDTNTHAVTIGGVEYEIPGIVFATEDALGIQSSDATYKNGSQALHAFQSDSGVAYRYLAVSADTSSFPLEKSLPNGSQFAFYHFDDDSYIAGVREFLDFVNESALLKRISQLPKPFSMDTDVIKAYERFFQEFGSHVVTGVTYGARCRLCVWASNAYPDVNKNWSRDVTASVKGLMSGGRYDNTVFEEPQYQLFATIMQQSLTVLGGDGALAAALMQGQVDFDKFKQWIGTIEAKPAFVTLKATELWTILMNTNNSDLRDSAGSIRDAFNGIVAHHQQAQTSTLVIFEIESGWAELGILTPSAIVGIGGPQPAFDPSTERILGLSETKIRWGKEGDEKKNVIIPIYVVNDGTPLDLYISRGSGKAQITIGPNVYINDGESSTKWFYQVPVTSTSEALPVEGNGK